MPSAGYAATSGSAVASELWAATFASLVSTTVGVLVEKTLVMAASALAGIDLLRAIIAPAN
ncbi:hypothetical protein GCM10025870_29790 [Agromyces marinus]|uniref:Uncharacterized protein n=1 Tax=Agromyces marinus TaxID=1389020 RepID=A0ABM8H584_9MICO|nr:hypothetical protein [Agromyces marinus]BDZ55906.1 hypothetical protein GCM10025870_29790 [Agromyces marinus]